MCYVHNQWYDISCATLYYEIFSPLRTAINMYDKKKAIKTGERNVPEFLRVTGVINPSFCNYV